MRHCGHLLNRCVNSGVPAWETSSFTKSWKKVLWQKKSRERQFSSSKESYCILSFHFISLSSPKAAGACSLCPLLLQGMAGDNSSTPHLNHGQNKFLNVMATINTQQHNPAPLPCNVLQWFLSRQSQSSQTWLVFLLSGWINTDLYGTWAEDCLDKEERGKGRENPWTCRGFVGVQGGGRKIFQVDHSGYHHIPSTASQIVSLGFITASLLPH